MLNNYFPINTAVLLFFLGVDEEHCLDIVVFKHVEVFDMKRNWAYENVTCPKFCDFEGSEEVWVNFNQFPINDIDLVGVTVAIMIFGFVSALVSVRIHYVYLS